jgi:hypothetical protein
LSDKGDVGLHVNFCRASFAARRIFFASFAGDVLRHRSLPLNLFKHDVELLKEKETVILNFRKIRIDQIMEELQQFLYH